MNANVAEIVVQYLEEIGVKHVFGVSGHSVFAITDALYKHPSVKFVPAQHEGPASYMAAAYAAGARTLGVALASGGPGAANLVSGVALAHKESRPLLALVSDVDRNLADKGASSWHGIPQEQIFAPVTKMAVTLKSAEDTLLTLHEAVRVATSGRKGPVFIGLPTDVQEETTEVPPHPWARAATPPPQADAESIRRGVAALLAAERLTIIAGGGVYWSQSEAEVLELAELLRAPFGTTPSQKGLLSEEHPLSLGALGWIGAPYANQVCQESDVILAVGTTFSEALAGFRLGNSVIPKDAKIVHVDLDGEEVGKIYPVHVGIIGDARAALRAMIQQLKDGGSARRGPTPRLERIAGERRAWRAELAQRGAPTAGPIDQWQLYHALGEALPLDAVVVGGGSTKGLLERFVARSRVHHSGDYQAIGTGLSTAIALQCAHPNQQVVCVSGDGSLMMEMTELATAVRERIPVMTIVINNGSYGNMKKDQILHYDGRVIGTELQLPDLPAVASAFGAYGARVERSADLVPAIKAAAASGKPSVIDVVCAIEGL